MASLEEDSDENRGRMTGGNNEGGGESKVT